MIAPTGHEVFFDRNDLIVSKTDLKGRITYANDVFMNTAGYTRTELVGRPHNLVRHPDMPRCVFKLLWETIADGTEVFAYVVNLARNGDHYWVLAHVTPSYDVDGNRVGYHSTRRVPSRDVVRNAIVPLYRDLVRTEDSFRDRAAGLAASYRKLGDILAARNVRYDEFVAGLGNAA